MSRFVRFAGHRTADVVLRAQRVDDSIRAVNDALAQTQQLNQLHQVAVTYGLSAPVIASMAVSPILAERLPAASSFNIVPEHKSSHKQQLGLEALTEASVTANDSVKDAATTVVASLSATLNSLQTTAEDFRGQLAYAHNLISQVDVADEVVEQLQVTTLTSTGFERLFAILETNLANVVPFDVAHLQANPEQVQDEVTALVNLLGEVGPVLGLEISAYGIRNVPKAEEYDVRTSTFGELGLDKSTLLFYLAKGEGLCDQLVTIGEAKDAILAAMTSAVAETPTQLNGDDVVYGGSDHLTLFTCYTKLVSGLIQESILAVARLLTASEVILESEAGQSDAADEPVAG